MRNAFTEFPADLVVTIESDLMENFSASSPVSCTKPISAVQDSQGNPIVLSIGTDNELWIIYRDPSSATGWSQQDISSGLGSDITVVAMTAAQLPSTGQATSNGQFCIAIAVAPGAGQTSTPVWVTSWLPNDLTGMDWANFSTNWKLRSAQQLIDPNHVSTGSEPLSNTVVNRLLMGAGSSTATAPLIIAAATQGNTTYHWMVNGNAADSTWDWAVYPMPTDADSILDMAVGYLSQGLGTYVLYTTAQGTQLEFSTAPKPVGGNSLPYTHLFLPASGQTWLAQGKCLAVLPDPAVPHYTNLYVGGGGVTYLDHGVQGQKIISGVPVLTSTKFPSVQQMILAQDQDQVSLWVLNRTTQNLSYTTGPQNAVNGSVWTPPLQLATHVAHMAALRSGLTGGNMIVTAFSDNTLAYQWQDPTTTLWRSTSIPLTDLVDDPIHKFPSYTSYIHLADGQGTSVIGATVGLTSSQWAYVTVNGFSYVVGPETPVNVTTDVMGNLTIIMQTESVSTPIYQIGLPSGVHTVNPAANAISRLSAAKTGADLKAITLADGAPLLPAGTTDQTADFTALCLQRLTAYIATLPSDGSPVADTTGSPQPNQTWGGSVSGGQITQVTEPAALLAMMPPTLQLAMTSDTVGGIIEGVCGDVLKFAHTVKKDIRAVVFTVVKGVVKFAIEIAGEWIYITLRAVGDVLELINWLLSLVGIDLSAIIQWLGQLFGWDDIVTTGLVFENIAHQIFEFGKVSIGELQTLTKSYLESLLKKVDAIGSVPLLPPDVAQTNVVGTAQSTQPNTPQGQQASSFFTQSAGGNFIYYQMLHGGILNGPASDQGSGSQPLADFVTNTLLPTLNRIDQEMITMIQTLLTGFRAGTLTIGEVVALVTKAIAELAVELLETIADGLFAVTDLVLDSMETSLFGSINVPFLTALYKLFTGLDSMSLVGGLSLLVAIPSTIAYRMVKGAAPFPPDCPLETITWQEVAAELKSRPKSLVLTASSDESGKGTSHGQFSSGIVAYSQIGGLASLACGVLGELFTLVQMGSESELKFVAKLSMGVTIFNLAATFPIDSNADQEWLGIGAYGLSAIDAVAEAVLFFQPRDSGGKTVKWKPSSGPLKGHTLAPVWEVAKGGMDTILGVVYLGDYIWSFVLEMGADSSDDISTDVDKFLQNIASAVTTSGNGLAAIAGDENPEVSLPSALIAGIALAIGTVLGGARAFTSIHDGSFYQSS